MVKFRNGYPTIIAVSDAEDIDSFRMALCNVGIYISAGDTNFAKEHINESDILIIFSQNYSSRITELLYSIESAEKMPKIIYVGSENDLPKKDGITVMPYIPSTVANEMYEILTECYHFDPKTAQDEEILCELIKPAQVYYNGTKLFLSKSEARIVHFLLTVEHMSLVPKETIGEYLLIAPGAVPVHIHNINDKSMKSYHDKLIFARSSRGYFVY